MQGAAYEVFQEQKNVICIIGDRRFERRVWFKIKSLILIKFLTMTIDNSKTIISLRIKLFAATVVLLAFLAMAFVIKMIKFPLLGIGETPWTVVLVGIWLILAFMPTILNYQYIKYSDEGEFIVFRYFMAGIVGGKKNSVEINKATFAGYKTESRFFGLSQSLILFQNMQQGVAKYPPIHISALTREEKAKVYKSLTLHSRPA
jgi:hypothetical protein